MSPNRICITGAQRCQSQSLLKKQRGADFDAERFVNDKHKNPLLDGVTKEVRNEAEMIKLCTDNIVAIFLAAIPDSSLTSQALAVLLPMSRCSCAHIRLPVVRAQTISISIGRLPPPHLDCPYVLLNV